MNDAEMRMVRWQYTTRSPIQTPHVIGIMMWVW